MAMADPLSRLSRQEHRVDNFDLPLLLEMLLAELPEDIRKLEHFRVNAEKDTNVVTRIVQRWRTLGNPISNAIGDSGKNGFLIAAPYADKLPLKVAEYIRQDTLRSTSTSLSSQRDRQNREKRNRRNSTRQEITYEARHLNIVRAGMADKPSQLQPDNVSALRILHGEPGR